MYQCISVQNVAAQRLEKILLYCMSLTASESINLESRALYFHWDIPWIELLVTACEMVVFSLIYFYPRTAHFILLDLITITSLREDIN
jgi:hypothetical protein